MLHPTVFAVQDDTGRAEIEFPGAAAHGFRDFRIIEASMIGTLYHLMPVDLHTLCMLVE